MNFLMNLHKSCADGNGASSNPVTRQGTKTNNSSGISNQMNQLSVVGRSPSSKMFDSDQNSLGLFNPQSILANAAM